MSYNIYLVEDEENLNQVLKSYLEKEGWKVTSFLKGESAREYIKKEPHLWILDIMLPDIDGYQLIKEIKHQNQNIPVIFISARDKDLDKIIGLEMGSDDYLAKPFLPRELVIRTKKLLERVYKNLSIKKENDEIVFINQYNINLSKRIVKKEQNIIELTSKEFDLLILFAQNELKAFSRQQILNTIWGEDYFGSDRVVDDLMRRLRKKVSDIKIETIYGFGYRMISR